MRDKLGEPVRIGHVLDAIAHVENFTAGKTEDSLTNEPMLRFAVERQLEIIGEASNYILPETKQRIGHIDWKLIKSFRNIVAHEYFGLDYSIVWHIVTVDLPLLKQALQSL